VIAILGIVLLNVQSFKAGNLGWVILPLLGAFVYAIYMNASPQVSSAMAPEAGIMLGLAMIAVVLSPVLSFSPRIGSIPRPGAWRFRQHWGWLEASVSGSSSSA